MKLEYDGDDLIRVVVIFCPWCNMFFSKTGTEIGTERLVSHEFTALSAQFYHELMIFFGTAKSLFDRIYLKAIAQPGPNRFLEVVGTRSANASFCTNSLGLFGG